MTSWSAIAGIVAAVLLSTLANRPAEAAKARWTDWGTVQSERYGFSIAYPKQVFAPDEGAAKEEGQVLVSTDGKARLVVGTFQNEGNVTLADYRTQLLEDNYTGANLDYAPVKDKWFIISGTREGMHFYERVSFTCGGRLINSWAMLYPASDKRLYDRVVEAIARTYTPGAGRDGNCQE